MSERKGKTLVGDDWASVSKFQKKIRFPLFDRVCCTVSHQCKRFASSPRLISPESIFWARVQCSLTEGEVIVAESFSGNFLFDCHHLKITNHPQGAGCCTRCFKCSSCSWNQLIVNISLKKSMLMLLLNFHFHSFFYFHHATPLSHPTGPLRPVWSWCITNKPFVKWQK